MFGKFIGKVRAWAQARVDRKHVYKKETVTGDMKGQFIPPLDSIITMGGFKYRVRKITDKDLILRPVGNA